MKLCTTAGFETRSGAFSAAPLSAVRIPAPISISIASDALIAIIISQTAR